MDFSLRNLFVVPSTNTIPTSGSTEDLTAGQVGFFKTDFTTTDGTGSPAYIYIAQGRAEQYLMASKKSDKIAVSKVKVKYKVTGSATPVNEIQELSNFTVKCGEDLTVTFRLHSSYIDATSFNGLTRSVTVKAPCCECEGSDCADVDAEALVDSIITKINQESALSSDPAALKLTTYLTFQKSGTGSTTKLRVSTKPLTRYLQACDIAANPWEFDRIWFRAFVYKGPDTMSDFIVADSCDPAGTVTVLQRSSSPRNTSDEIRQLEKDYHSYQSIHKHLFRMAGYNQTFESYVEDNKVYTLFYIQFDQYDDDLSWNPGVKMDEGVIIAAESTVAAATSTVLTNFFGTFADKSGPVVTTTTTTSTTTTSTTSTTTLIP